jgi:hypothetical protein
MASVVFTQHLATIGPHGVVSYDGATVADVLTGVFAD